MLEPRRIESIIVPEVFEDLGNGNWYYNYDIQSEEVNIPSMDEGQVDRIETRYSYIQVRVPSKPEYKTCVCLILEQYITQSQEFDLINSYNRTLLGLAPEDSIESVTEKYKQYLNLVDQIKCKVKQDFGIVQ